MSLRELAIRAQPSDYIDVSLIDASGNGAKMVSPNDYLPYAIALNIEGLPRLVSVEIGPVAVAIQLLLGNEGLIKYGPGLFALARELEKRYQGRVLGPAEYKVLVQQGTPPRVPEISAQAVGETARTPSPAVIRAVSPTVPRVPSPTVPRVPSPTVPRVPSPTVPRVPSPTVPRVPSPTVSRVPLPAMAPTTLRVPSPTVPSLTQIPSQAITKSATPTPVVILTTPTATPTSVVIVTSRVVSSDSLSAPGFPLVPPEYFFRLFF